VRVSLQCDRSPLEDQVETVSVLTFFYDIVPKVEVQNFQAIAQLASLVVVQVFQHLNIIQESFVLLTVFYRTLLHDVIKSLSIQTV